MSNNLPLRKIGFQDLDIFPVFIDYDMEEMKCRGLSAKIDLFSYGKLSAEIDKLKRGGLDFAVEEGVMIKKNGLIFSSGFFILDFKYYVEHPDKFIKKITLLNMSVVYIENSERFDLGFLGSAGCGVELLEIDNA